jgi:hypothetical protein
MRIKLPSEFDEYEAIMLTTDANNEVAEKWAGIRLGLLTAFCARVLGSYIGNWSKAFVRCRHLMLPLTASGVATIVRAFPTTVRPSLLILRVISIRWS